MPFKHPATDATSKGSMAVKTGVFLTVGMSIPVGMSFYQLYVFCLWGHLSDDADDVAIVGGSKAPHK